MYWAKPKSSTGNSVNCTELSYELSIVSIIYDKRKCEDLKIE